jgi:4-hydroxybenzoate polyprenyltransferase
MAYLTSIRPINLVLLAYAQYLIKYVVFRSLGATTTLGDLQFGLLVFATLCIAAGGYVINDLHDLQTDTINRPQKVRAGVHVSEKNSSLFYMVVTTFGVGLGFYLSYTIEKPGFAAIFVAVAALLYLYATYLKSILLVGNILISMLVGFSLILVVLFDILPSTYSFNMVRHQDIFKTVLLYAGFAFWLNLIREIVKDIQDINGDQNAGRNTLPIAIGRSRATTVVLGLAVLLTFATLAYVYYVLYVNQVAVLYFLLSIVAPLLYFCVKCYHAERQKDFALLSILAKIVFFSGVSSLWLFPLLKNNLV